MARPSAASGRLAENHARRRRRWCRRRAPAAPADVPATASALAARHAHHVVRRRPPRASTASSMCGALHPVRHADLRQQLAPPRRHRRRGTRPAGRVALASVAMIRVIGRECCGRGRAARPAPPAPGRAAASAATATSVNWLRASTSGARPSAPPMRNARSSPACWRALEPAGQLARGQLRAALIEGHDVLAGSQRGQQALRPRRRSRAGARAAGVRAPARSRTSVTRQRRRQAREVVIAGAAHPGGHARAHGDHAHAHGGELARDAPPPRRGARATVGVAAQARPPGRRSQRRSSP